VRLDSVIVAGVAILISFLSTLYPSAAASKLQPVESLRYE
jgi:ABC-type lipoprotein release transport system permease subunit